MSIFRSLPLLMLLVSLESHSFESSYKNKDDIIPQSIMGLSTYLGRISNGSNSSSMYLGASLYAYFFNGALEVRAQKDGFDNDNQVQPYLGVGLGRFLQIQRGVDFTTTNRFRIVSEIAFNEWIETRNHITLQGFIEQIDTSSEHDRRYGIALGYTF